MGENHKSAHVVRFNNSRELCWFCSMPDGTGSARLLLSPSQEFGCLVFLSMCACYAFVLKHSSVFQTSILSQTVWFGFVKSISSLHTAWLFVRLPKTLAFLFWLNPQIRACTQKQSSCVDLTF